MDAAVLRRAIAGTAIGNFMESYDFSVYSLVATLLAQTFYPGNGSGAGNLIATFGTLAVAFIVRPLGGFVFGPLGDRIGRKPVLLITIALMTFSATATGLLPTYRSIGVWAPCLLILVRLCQGLSTGGEYAGAMTYIVEAAPDRRRGMLAGFLPMGTLSGNVAAIAMVTGLQVALPQHDMASWGWRIPFFLALPLGLTAVVLRLRLDDTFDRGATAEKDRAAFRPGQFDQLKQIIAGHWKALLVCIGLELTICNTNYNAQRILADLPEGDRADTRRCGVGDDSAGDDLRVDRGGLRRENIRPDRGEAADSDGLRLALRRLDTGLHVDPFRLQLPDEIPRCADHRANAVVSEQY